MIPDRDSLDRVFAGAEHSRAMEVSLLLASQGIEHWIESNRAESEIYVSLADAPYARQQIDTYDAENASGVEMEPVREELALHLTPLFLLLVPTLAYFGLGLQDDYPLFREQGLAAAKRILAGEVWRCWTALTLHADAQHFLGNLIGGYFLLNLLVNRIRIGTISIMSTLSAGIANFLVALTAATNHRSLGFSTAVFAFLGMLAASETVRWRKKNQGHYTLRASSPMLAAFFMVVMMGLGESSDIRAHFYGFACGSVAGYLHSFWPARWNRSKVQTLLVAGTWMVFAGAWWLAIR